MKKTIATAISTACIISGYFPQMPAMANEPSLSHPGSAAAHNVQDYVSVDVEIRSPEGSVNVYSKIYMRQGDQYKNTLGESIAASYVEKVRQYAIESESNQAVDLAPFGINPQSVRKKVDEFLKSNTLPSIDPQKYPHPNFDQLDPAVRKLLDYDTVAHAASEAISHPFNTGYFIMHVYISGDRPVEMQSRHEGGGMVPWTVKVGSKVWQTASPQLPKMLADLGNNDFLRGKHADWFDQFFDRYSAKVRNQNWPSIKDREMVKQIAGWQNASKFVTVEDAINQNDSTLIQVKLKDPACAIDRIRWRVGKPGASGNNAIMRDWDAFIAANEKLQHAANSVGWLRKWREQNPERSLMAMFDVAIDPADYFHKEMIAFWQDAGLSGQPTYHCRVYRNGTYEGGLLLGEPYQISLATEMIRHQWSWINKPDSDAFPTLRDQCMEDVPFDQRKWCLLDQSGKIIKLGPPPLTEALPSGCEYPTAQDEPYDYFWPVDFDKAEDAEYLDRKIGNESIANCSPEFAPSLVGEIDKGGKPIFKPLYQFLGPTSEGMTVFRLPKGKNGYLNEAGDVAIDPQYDEAEAFHEGLAAVGKDHKYGFIDTKGNVVIPMIFDAVRNFAEGLAPARIGALFGYIDKTGKFVIEPQFGRARHFINGLAYVQNDWRRAYIDHAGKPIGGCFYEQLQRFSCDRAKFKQDGKYGYIDRAGRVVIPARYDDANDFRDGVAKVEINGVAKGIDIFGKSAPVPPDHSDFWAGPISEGLMDTTGSGKNAMSHGLMDRNGKFVIKPIYESVGAFVGGLCPVQINHKWGVIDRSGKMVIKPQFDETTRLFSDNRLGVKVGKKWGLIDVTGSMILEPKYDAIQPFKNGMAIVQSGIKFGYIDKSGVELIPPIFDAAHQFGPTGRARVKMRVEPVKAMEIWMEGERGAD